MLYSFPTFLYIENYLYSITISIYLSKQITFSFAISTVFIKNSIKLYVLIKFYLYTQKILKIYFRFSTFNCLNLPLQFIINRSVSVYFCRIFCSYNFRFLNCTIYHHCYTLKIKFSSTHY